MNYRVSLTARAERQLESAYEWWASHRSFDQATRRYEAFYASLESLKVMPERRPLSLENQLIAVEIRDHCFGAGPRPTHRAVFTIRTDEIVILAVRHLAQDALTADDLS